MKCCTKCGEEKDLNCFSFKNKKTGRKSSECKNCHRAMRKKHYESNLESERLKIYGRRKELVSWFKELKGGLKCEICSEDHIATLHFHHKNRSEKKFSLANGANNGYSKQTILDEIKKCKVLCGNCHAKLHYKIE